MPRKAEEEHMMFVLRRMLKQYGLNEGIDKVDIKDIYKEVVGDYIFKQTKTITLKKKVLFLHYEIPALRQEMSMTKSKLIEKINAKAQRKMIEEIVFA